MRESGSRWQRSRKQSSPLFTETLKMHLQVERFREKQLLSTDRRPQMSSEEKKKGSGWDQHTGERVVKEESFPHLGKSPQ